MPTRLTRQDGIGLASDPSHPLPTFAMALLFRELVDAAAAGGRARLDFADAYEVQAVVEVARRSSAEGTWVRPRSS